jgi:hypothetical protein
MPTILGANTLSGAYEVANSVRLDGSSSYMTKTMGTPTDADKYTFSFWCKRSKLGVQQSIFRSTNGAASNDSHVTFQADDTLRFEEYGGGATIGKLQTNQVFRDVTAWYHIVLVYDSGNGTAGNRMRMYVNGTEVTSFGTDTNPSQDADSYFNKDGEVLSFGRTPYSGGSTYFNGYVAELVMCDGQALTPTSFGEFDEDTPTIWKPKNVGGLTFGTNGFYLDFEDSGNLGNDKNGGTDFTESGLAAIDQSTDTCTNNFATMNPLNNYWAAATFSEGNSVYTSNNTSEYYGVAQSTFGVSSGKWYFEAKNSTDSSSQGILGITSRNQTGRGTWLGSTSQAYGYYANGGVIRSSASDTSYGATYTVNDIIGIYMDLDNNKMYVSDNGVLQNSGTGHTITAAASTDSGFYHFAVGDNSDNTQVWQCNFGGTSGFTVSSGNTDVNGYGNFEYDPSAGTFDGVSKDFLALCTKNIAEFG